MPCQQLRELHYPIPLFGGVARSDGVVLAPAIAIYIIL